MGYYVNYEISDLIISKDKVQACLAAINALHQDEVLEKMASGGSWGGDSDARPIRERVWYSWVGNPPEGGFTSLEDAFTAWRFAAHEDLEGNVILDQFNGEKVGDEAVLFQAIAPFLNYEECEEYTIEARGEDGALWRWLFRGGKAEEQTGKVVWE